jgi:hypothetical protein
MQLVGEIHSGIYVVEEFLGGDFGPQDQRLQWKTPET